MPLRFGIGVDGINLKYKDFYIMYQPTWWRENFVEAKIKLDEDRYLKQFGPREEKVHDTRLNESRGEVIVENVEYEEKTAKTTVEKRGPGRPKGSKNKKE